MRLKFTKVRAGWYATEDGFFAVVHDGYPAIQSVAADAHYEGFIGGEWAAVVGSGLREDHNAGENLDWFKTKREAVEYLNAQSGAMT